MATPPPISRPINRVGVFWRTPTGPARYQWTVRLRPQSIPCPDCGYDLQGVPVSCCPECGSAFTEADLARVCERRAALWREQMDHLRAARALWIAMLVAVGVPACGFLLAGDWEIAWLALLACIAGLIGLAATLAVHARARSVVADPERSGRSPSGRLQVAVLGVTLPSFLIALPCVAFGVVALVSVGLVWLWT